MDQTPETQLEALRAFAANRGWQAREYVDHGVSGAPGAAGWRAWQTT